MVREAWGPCGRISVGSRTLGMHAKVLSGHPAEGVHTPRRRGNTEVGASGALGLFMKGRQVASVFHRVHGAASPWLPSSLPAPGRGGAGKGEQLLLKSASLPGSRASVLLMSCSSGEFKETGFGLRPCLEGGPADARCKPELPPLGESGLLTGL